jgi:hypothetical protein
MIFYSQSTPLPLSYIESNPNIPLWPLASSAGTPQSQIIITGELSPCSLSPARWDILPHFILSMRELKCTLNERIKMYLN